MLTDEYSVVAVKIQLNRGVGYTNPHIWYSFVNINGNGICSDTAHRPPILPEKPDLLTAFGGAQPSQSYTVKKRTMASSTLQAGSVLLAEPFLNDSNFKRAAILLCEHSEDGSLGFILNKELDMRIGELLPDLNDFEVPVFFGGPVQTDSVHYLHTVGDLLDDSIQVCPGVYWGGNFEKLKFLIANKLVPTDSIRFFVGYSGWSQGQLMEELQTGSWVTTHMDANYLFGSTRNGALWRKIMAHKGGSFGVIAQMKDSMLEN